ncbi:MAG: peroxidase-related enzyme [Gemmatimonadetes bacterium]|jgi:uncharacterized peroxidase-related enzyme|nr:peroxidase-related enzyme [Gemmatimonadota bacterium]MBA4160255.1 peroxidase-related enzyme [Gemmatimonadota bacterium]
MTWIEVVGESEASDELKSVYERIKGARGKLSNIMQVQSLNPKAMAAHLDLYMALLFDRSGLTRAERELIAVVVSASNECEYCVSHHATALQAYWKDETRVRAAIHDYTKVELSARERAVADYAVALTRDPGCVTERNILAMRAEGLSDAEILNVNMITAYFNFVNRIAMGLGADFSPEEVAGYRY